MATQSTESTSSTTPHPQDSAPGSKAWECSASATRQATAPRPSLSTTSGARPPAVAVGAGCQMYDTTLFRPIWSDGSVWRDAMGTAV